MLLDPLSGVYGFAPPSISGGTAFDFRRTAIGKYVAMNGPFSSDQMARLAINNQIRTNGPSILKWRLEVDKNVAPINGLSQQDDTLIFDIKCNANFRSFTAADIRNASQYSGTIFSAFVERFMAGES